MVNSLPVEMVELVGGDKEEEEKESEVDYCHLFICLCREEAHQCIALDVVFSKGFNRSCKNKNKISNQVTTTILIPNSITLSPDHCFNIKILHIGCNFTLHSCGLNRR